MSRRTGPQPGSVVFRMQAFFEANPDEELTFADASRKFDCSLASARDAVEQLRKATFLESVHVVRLRSKGIAK